MRKLRKILKLGSAFTITIPAEYIKDMELEKGDYVEVTKISPTEIIVRKVEIVPAQKKTKRKNISVI